MLKKIILTTSAFLLSAVLALGGWAWSGQQATASALRQDDIPQEVLLDNGFRISFDGVDYHDDGTSTWTYTVEELPSAMDLSNWVLETPFCAPIVDAGPEPWEIVDPDPNAKLSGVKWETGAGFQQGQFWVTLETTGAVGRTNVAAKGPNVAFGEIAGPTCAGDEPPPVDPPSGGDDQEAPTLEWVAPVGLEERFDVRNGDVVELIVDATDNVGVTRVEFLRWDAVNEVYVTIAVDNEAPYEAVVNASDLNPTWNHIRAASFDAAGNHSDWLGIWLYKIADGPLFSAADTSVFLPMILR